jgi:hypothetical protein
MKLLLVTLLLFINIFLHAQSKKQPRFASYNAIGLLAGKSEYAFSLQSVNGVHWGKWFVGGGIALDNYQRLSFPVFLDIKWEFDIKKLHFFLYADAGDQFVKGTGIPDDIYYRYDTKGGIYLDGGAGMLIPVAKKTAIFFTIGNTVKRYSDIVSTTDSNAPYSNETTYKLSTLSIRGGLRF